MNGMLRWMGVVGLAAGLCACSRREADAPRTAPDGARRIAVIPKGTTHVFWKTVEAGARQAATEHGLQMTWKGPMVENDRAQQIALVQQFVSERVDGIVLAPLDDRALRAPVRAAAEAGIPVVLFDSGLEGTPGEDFVCLVATDNRLAGEWCGRHLGDLLGGEGQVVMLRYLEGSASTAEREQGFLDAIAKFPGITVRVSDQYGGPTSSTAKDRAMNLIDDIRAADGIFCPNEPTVFGMLLALQANQLAGTKRFVGIDASEPLVEGLRAGQIDALVSQNPFRIGYLGVKALAVALAGGSNEPVQDTGCLLITEGNLDSDEVRALLQR
jgi:ribose transport system substrate-binding protein